MVTSPLSLIFSSSLYGAYHLASRVLPLRSRWSAILRVSATAAGREAEATHWRFCMSINDNILGAGWGAGQDDVATLKLRGFGRCGSVSGHSSVGTSLSTASRPLSLAEAEGSPVAGASASLATPRIGIAAQIMQVLLY